MGSLATGDTTTSFTQVFDSRNAGSRTLTPSGTVNDRNSGANYAATRTATLWFADSAATSPQKVTLTGVGQ